ncbi:hypothetical protein [Pseudoduganella namucuonensis]|uniref:Uncharacterized protein n=1 Tax=Pseudoduganella namucuonensis TaxID=1035707 RepID=A0A1I7L677_9BURK|nr:hypothetical protein [Pseudoduganella namucuonensis]SFV05115.1 hypothetical protein SAMN05216552_1023100 [Pseudoduganella namucuonensis]
MQTFPITTAGGTLIRAFELEHAYITIHDIATVLTSTEGVSHVRRRRRARDIRLEFSYHDRPFVVWEPHGDIGRFWIGPENADGFGDEVMTLKTRFDAFRPRLPRLLYGHLMTSWIFTHPFKKRHSRRARLLARIE